MTQEVGDFIEARLIGLQIDHDTATAILTLRDTKNSIWTLTAAGIEDMKISEFRSQNILDRIFIWDFESNPDDYKALLEPNNAELLQSIQNRELVIIEIEAIYGAAGFIAARNYALAPIS